MRKATVERKTKETDIRLTLNLDGNGTTKIHTSVPFLDHMLELMCNRAGYDMEIEAIGDQVDHHHVIEDIGICFGQAFYQALGNKAGIRRYGQRYLPMDESLVRVILDISGRPTLVYDLPIEREFLGDLETEMLEEFMIAFVNDARVTLHIKKEYGRNAHHLAEAMFKGLGMALGEATEVVDQSGKIPSTKGVLA